jgi:hypothetical protein
LREVRTFGTRVMGQTKQSAINSRRNYARRS